MTDAIDYFEKSLHIDRKATTLNGIAYTHFKAENLGDAISFYQEVLSHQESKNNFDALSGLFLIHTKQNQPELAKSYEK
ncbi:MAG: tetratricopeptide repeat protein [Nitrosopumilus sp.]|nr:tetratricopeptide repeat protein [Nitrosopumilus sp.]MDH3487033.1 tetratricopeptide repeat protein [Nitrosopumilus sp.]